MADTNVVMLTGPQWEEYQSNNRWMKRALFGLLTMLAITFMILLWLANDNHSVLGTIKRQTSPAAQKRQQDAVNDIVITIDCNNRKATQDAINQLAAQGIIKSIDVTAACRKGN